MRVIQQNQIGKHFNGAIGNIAINKRIFETLVTETQQQTTVRRLNSFYIANTRNTVLHGGNNALKDFRLTFINVLRYQLQVFA